MKDTRIALAQTAPRLGDVAANLDDHLDAAATARPLPADGTPLVLDTSTPRSSSTRRTLEPFLDVGARSEGISALEYVRMLERAGKAPDGVVYTPTNNTLPVVNR